MIATNPSLKTVLVVGVYLMHKLADPNDPMVFFYGDGAGAAVLEPGAAPGFVASASQAGGAYHRHWGLYAGGTFEPATVEAVEKGRTRVKMLERYPPEINHDGWPRLARRVAANGGFALADVDLIIFTQVRKPSIELVMADLGLPMEKTHTIMEAWGYTGSACIPMAFDDAVAKGRVKSGDLVVFIGSGVGYNQAGAAFRMP
jgi:3-oxoacyl-[acyl-carrier-protein] synthase-3